MITKPSSRDLRQVLLAAAPPLLIFGALLAVGELSLLGARTATFETSRLVAAVVAGAWLTVTTGMTVHRTRRDAHAHRRLQELRDAAQTSGKALIHVEAVACILEPANTLSSSTSPPATATGFGFPRPTYQTAHMPSSNSVSLASLFSTGSCRGQSKPRTGTNIATSSVAATAVMCQQELANPIPIGTTPVGSSKKPNVS
ncbi:MAG: hypothetical protein EOL89_10140 [Actinobacteria bacterium]|nr:hypothetical protein [Actinomycetota bacterium]